VLTSYWYFRIEVIFKLTSYRTFSICVSKQLHSGLTLNLWQWCHV